MEVAPFQDALKSASAWGGLDRFAKLSAIAVEAF
jgi:hypothetical protein